MPKNTKKTKKEEFPSNNRIITEEAPIKTQNSLSLRFILAIFSIFVLLMALGLLSFDLVKQIREGENRERERQEIISDINFWEMIINQYPDFKDAYLELAVLEYRIGDLSKASFYKDKVLYVNPNDIQARKLEEFLR